MKFVISYPTRERKYITAHTYQLVHKTVELEAVRLMRIPIGSRGAATNRYRYQAAFKAPQDAEFTLDGLITENIYRQLNKQFKPKDFNFTNNICWL